MLPQLLSKLTQKLLALDPFYLNNAQELFGHTFAFSFNNSVLPPLYLSIDPQGQWLWRGTIEGAADVTFSAHPLAWLRALTVTDFQAEWSKGHLKVTGNVPLALALWRLLHDLQPEWQVLVAQIVGDTLAHPTYSVLHKARGFLQQSSDDFLADIRVFLQQETQQLPSKSEIDFFLNAVDTVRHDTERLEARFSYLRGL